MGTLVLLTGCRRRSPLLLPPPLRSRSLLLLRGSTPSGSEAPSLLPSPPSSRCGSPSRSTTSAARPSSTRSASKHIVENLFVLTYLIVCSEFDLKIILFVFVKTFQNGGNILPSDTI